MGNYIQLQVESNDLIVTNEEFKEELNKKLLINSKIEEVSSRAVKKGDIVYVSFDTYVNNEKVMELCATDIEIEVGANDFNNEFENALINMKRDEKKVISINIPENLSTENYFNILADYEIKIEKITEIVLPKLDNNYVRENYGYETVEDFYDYLKDYIYNLKYEMYVDEQKEILINNVVQNTKFNCDISNLCKREFQEIYGGYESFAISYYDNNIEDLLESNDTSDEDIREYATEKVKEELIIEKIMEQENLKPTDTEQLSLEEHYISDYGYSDIDTFIEDCGEDYLNDEINREIVLDFIYKNTIIN